MTASQAPRPGQDAAAVLALAAAADGAWAARCARRHFGWAWVLVVPVELIPAARNPAVWRAVSTEAAGIPPDQEFWVDVETFVRVCRWHATVPVYVEGAGFAKTNVGFLPARTLRFEYPQSICYRRLIILVRLRQLPRRLLAWPRLHILTFGHRLLSLWYRLVPYRLRCRLSHLAAPILPSRYRLRRSGAGFGPATGTALLERPADEGTQDRENGSGHGRPPGP